MAPWYTGLGIVSATDLKVVGFDNREYSWYPPTTPKSYSMNIPEGTAEGDVLILAELTYPGTLTMPDARWTPFFMVNNSTDWVRAAWYHVYAGDDSPVAMTGSGFFNSTGQFFRTVLYSIRGAGAPDAGSIASASFPTIPALPGESQGLGISFGRAGIGGIGGNPWSGTNWIVQDSGFASYVSISLALNKGPTIPQQTTNYAGNTSVFDYAVIGTAH